MRQTYTVALPSVSEFKLENTPSYPIPDTLAQNTPFHLGALHLTNLLGALEGGDHTFADLVNALPNTWRVVNDNAYDTAIAITLIAITAITTRTL